MLEQVGELGVRSNLSKGGSHVAKADVVAQVGQELEDELGCLRILAGQKRRARRKLHRGDKGARADRDLLEVEQLSHLRLPLSRGPRKGLPFPSL